MQRRFDYDIMTEIKQRWSPRAFSDKEVPEDVLLALLEAARYAPSCANEQPLRFMVASKQDDLEKLSVTAET